MAKKPTRAEIQGAIGAAKAAVRDGERLRRELRRKARPGAPARQGRLIEAIAMLCLSGERLRSLSGHIQWGRVRPADEAKLKEASAAVDRERRKLRKMIR